MDYKIVWRGKPYPEHEAQLRKSIEKHLGTDTDIANLFVRRYFLGDFEGPSIDCYWDPKDEVIKARYYAETVWEEARTVGEEAR